MPTSAFSWWKQEEFSQSREQDKFRPWLTSILLFFNFIWIDSRRRVSRVYWCLLLWYFSFLFLPFLFLHLTSLIIFIYQLKLTTQSQQFSPMVLSPMPTTFQPLSFLILFQVQHGTTTIALRSMILHLNLSVKHYKISFSSTEIAKKSSTILKELLVNIGPTMDTWVDPQCGMRNPIAFI